MLTIFLILHIICSMTYLFYNSEFVLLKNLHRLCPSPHSTSLWQLPFVLCIYEPISLLFCFVCFEFQITHMSEIMLFVSDLFTQHNALQVHPLLSQVARFYSFLRLSHSPFDIYTPHLLFPFIYQWTFRLFPYLDYCE